MSSDLSARKNLIHGRDLNSIETADNLGVISNHGVYNWGSFISNEAFFPIEAKRPEIDLCPVNPWFLWMFMYTFSLSTRQCDSSTQSLTCFPQTRLKQAEMSEF